MRLPQEPLSADETTELQKLLQQSGERSLAFARGVFAATATAPSELSPEDWLTLLAGNAVEDRPALRRLTSLLLREYNACADCLELRVPVVPAAEQPEAVRDFCRGYMQVAHRDERWKTDMEAFAATIPLAMLAGYLDPESLKGSLRGDETPEQYRSRHERELTEDVARLFEFWRQARAERAKPQQAVSDKVGRNAPCPCGSGKKYKKCCGA